MMSHNNGYDVIGDIHGQADKLTALLKKMGYTQRHGSWLPPAGRVAVYLGDLIDRGPKQVETLNIVRGMVEAGRAHCIMGNHELNALAYATESGGSWLRPHSEKNVQQHAAFLEQVPERDGLRASYLDWFRTLPVTLDLDGIRVVHAWWHPPHIETLESHRGAAAAPLEDDFLRQAFSKGSDLYKAVDGLTKGLEVPLPDGHSFLDHAGIRRSEIRVRWWLDAPTSYRHAALQGAAADSAMPDLPMPDDIPWSHPVGTPIFVGHYWMSGRPGIQTPKLACLDWSAAKDGPLVSYRWDGETTLRDANLVWIDPAPSLAAIPEAR
jgi:hypothetical protein